MSLAVTEKPRTSVDITDIEKLIMNGDLSRLSPEQRMQYYRYRCESMGLDPMSRPFDYLELNRKLVLYLNRGGSEQLRKVHNVSIIVTDKKLENDVFTVYVRATTPEGRTEDECGSVSVGGAKGEMLANLHMKAITKAKRRATISICGLGMLDETEVDSIPGARSVMPPIEERPSAPVQVKTAPFILNTPIVKDLPSDPGDATIPYGSLKGKKLKELPSEEWRSYIMRVREALQDETMPQDKREEAVEVIEFIEGYLSL